VIDLFCNIYFYGYHTLPEGISLINEIKDRMNNLRLTTKPINGGSSVSTVSSLETETKISSFFLPGPLDLVFTKRLRLEWFLIIPLPPSEA
jgi:hypothetical protein